MSDDAKAKIRLMDGREVWRKVKVEYREVGTGRWVSAGDVDSLLLPEWSETDAPLGKPKAEIGKIRQQIVDVQSRIALDREVGAGSTSAARLVLKTLNEMENSHLAEGQTKPWFVLGRQLAVQILKLIEEEQERDRSQNSQI
jgi:hypothetical protein